MNELNLDSVDLNLLPPLQALIKRRHITRAAADVGLSQPAMSRAVGRLRAVLGDEIVVRRGRAIVLTPAAEALAGVRRVFRPDTFVPMEAQRVVVIAAADLMTVMVAPVLTRRLQTAAPGIVVRMVAYDPDIIGRVSRGEVDFAFSVDAQPLPPSAASIALYRDDLAVVMRRDHPAAGAPFALADYGRFGHVSVSIFGDNASDLDARLAAAGVCRRIVLTTPHFMAALAAAAATDVVTTLGRRFAGTFAERFGLILKDPPFADTSYGLTLAWDRLRGEDPLLAWVREEIVAAALETAALSPPPKS